MARKMPHVAQVMASLAGEYEAVLIARSDGVVAADVRPLVRVSLAWCCVDGGRREQGHAGGAAGSTTATPTRCWKRMWRRPSDRHCSISMRAMRHGDDDVRVLGHGWPACRRDGHGLEEPSNRKSSELWVASGSASRRPASTDDGTIDRRRGWLNIDDEGHPTRAKRAC